MSPQVQNNVVGAGVVVVVVVVVAVVKGKEQLKSQMKVVTPGPPNGDNSRSVT